MKTINLLHSRLPLPADGPLPDFSDFLPSAQGGESVGGKIPFFLRGSVILLLLLVGLGLVGAGVYRFLVSPLDFSGEPRPMVQESPGAMKAKPVPHLEAAKPLEEKQTAEKGAEIPVVSPVSPPETTPVSKPPPPKKPPAETVATALLPAASDKDVEQKPPSTVVKKEASSLAPKMPQKAPEKTASVSSGLTDSPKRSKEEAPSEVERKASVPGGEQKEPVPVTAPPKPESASKAEPAEQKETSPKTKVSTPTEKEAPKLQEQIEAPPGTPPQAETSPKSKLAAVVRTGGYSIQVGACKTPRCIQRFLEKIQKAGFTPHTKASANQKLTLIRVGSYKTVAETKSDIQQLRAKGFKGSYAVKQ